MKPLFLFPLAPLSEFWEQRRLFQETPDRPLSLDEQLKEDQEELSAKIAERKANLQQEVGSSQEQQQKVKRTSPFMVNFSEEYSTDKSKSSEIKNYSAGSLTPEVAAQFGKELPRKTQKKAIEKAESRVASGESPTLGDAIAALFREFQKFLGGNNISPENQTGNPAPTNGNYLHPSELSPAGRTQETLGTINDPETRQKVSEFCDQYRGSQYLSKDFRSSPYINFRGSEKCMVNNEALPDLAKLAVIYHQKTGKKLTITSAYRDIAHQKRLQNGPNPAATPGNSNHNTGHALDFGQDVVRGYPGFGALARACNFAGISSENWHFNHRSMKNPGQTRIAFAQQVDRSVA